MPIHGGKLAKILESIFLGQSIQTFRMIF